MGKKKKADKSSAPATEESIPVAVELKSKKQKANNTSEAAVAKQPVEETKGKRQKASTEEIDDIFNSGKRRKVEASAAAAEPSAANGDTAQKEGIVAAEKITKSKAPAVVGNKDDIFGEETRSGRKKTEEGFFIYTEDELGLNKKGGDTDLCPFDCDCCF